MSASKKSPMCAICEQRPIDPAYRPFCSRRCADIDLGRWLKGGYAIPGEPAEQDREPSAPPGEDKEPD